MVVTDTIADFLTRIRNANMVKHETVLIPSSNTKVSLAKLLKEEGFIADYEVIEDNGFKNIKITLKYVNGKKAIQGLKRISKPGLRVYVEAKNLPKVLNGLGIAIVSTNKGILTDEQARNANVGGEVLAYVW